MEEIDIAVDNLKKAIIKLQKESENFYDKGDNFRGNIRHDASRDLRLKLDALIISKSYIKEALKK